MARDVPGMDNAGCSSSECVLVLSWDALRELGVADAV